MSRRGEKNGEVLGDVTSRIGKRNPAEKRRKREGERADGRRKTEDAGNIGDEDSE